MVCPRLNAGICGVTKGLCKSKYEIKMINYKKCKLYKAKVKKTKKAKAKKRRLF